MLNLLQIDIQDFSLVQAIRSCVVDGAHLLALGNEQGLQVPHAACRVSATAGCWPSDTQQMYTESDSCCVADALYISDSDGCNCYILNSCN
jgi:hypothetical protein